MAPARYCRSIFSTHDRNTPEPPREVDSSNIVVRYTVIYFKQFYCLLKEERSIEKTYTENKRTNKIVTRGHNTSER